jgi:hypothetical protein
MTLGTLARREPELAQTADDRLGHGRRIHPVIPTFDLLF